MKDLQEFRTRVTKRPRWRRFAWLVIAIADAGLLAWGAMAALAPEYLLGPNSTAILNAEYQSYTGLSWAALTPRAAAFITLVFRMYGVYIVTFGLLAITVTATAFRRGERWAWWALLVTNTIAYGSAMTYDLTVNAIGPFEFTEYIFLAAIYVTLAVTAPNMLRRRPLETTMVR